MGENERVFHKLPEDLLTDLADEGSVPTLHPDHKFIDTAVEVSVKIRKVGYYAPILSVERTAYTHGEDPRGTARRTANEILEDNHLSVARQLYDNTKDR